MATDRVEAIAAAKRGGEKTVAPWSHDVPEIHRNQKAGSTSLDAQSASATEFWRHRKSFIHRGTRSLRGGRACLEDSKDLVGVAAKSRETSTTHDAAASFSIFYCASQTGRVWSRLLSLIYHLDPNFDLDRTRPTTASLSEPEQCLSVRPCLDCENPPRGLRSLRVLPVDATNKIMRM